MIGIYDIDKTDYPNYALMKVAAYHRNQGDAVACYTPLEAPRFDVVYASSVFTFSDKSYTFDNMVTGGTGFDVKSELPPEIEAGEPDYSMYPNMIHALGFLTRGCIRRCPECFVPEKEGKLRAYRDIDTIAQGRRDVVLMDNNVLASAHGLQQIERIVDHKLRVDFNQGLDARLITDEVARLLARVRWLEPLRLACDSDAMIDNVAKAVERLRWYNIRPQKFFVYVLMRDMDSTLRRVKFLKGIHCDPFVQPYRDAIGTDPPIEHRKFARWVNHKAVFNSVLQEDYK